MLFNSFEYLVFLPLAVAGYFLLPARLRNLWLLLASCVFYMVYRPGYILVLAGLIGIDYSAGILIEGASRQRARQYLLASIFATCAVLVAFKYFDFFAESLWLALRLHRKPPVTGWPLPIGLSFHTFQSLAYVIEVYRGRQSAERNPVTYATYVLFFPQLVAGPIERPGHMLHQFVAFHRFDPVRVSHGLRRIAWGLFKKSVIADRLALFVNDVYAKPQDFGGFYLTAAAVAFTYQIYCDFSGYTDIALGSAQVLGFRLCENFDSPFRAASLADFWRRWHISLSSWFRDYVYIPLGGNRGTKFLTARNIIITFALSGLWHGASWTYVVWGLAHGVYLLLERGSEPIRRRVFAALSMAKGDPFRESAGMLLTFAFVCASFVLFRAQSLSQAKYFFTHFYLQWGSISGFETARLNHEQCKIAVSAVLFLEAVQWVLRHPGLLSRFEMIPAAVRRLGYLGFAVSIPLLGVYFEKGSFLYFQF